MKSSWSKTFRRLAVGCVVSGTVAWSSAMCFAVTLATDSANDAAYADGWQDGDNGGTGFDPWDFDGSYGGGGSIHEVDNGLQAGTANSSTFNNVGRAWRMAQQSGGLPRAGRGFDPLQIGQTLSMVIDNPTARQFFKGYIIRLNSGGGNICYGGTPCTPGTNPIERLGVYVFDYFTYGNWLVSDAADDNHGTTLFDEDTASAGVRIDVKLTGPESYELVMDPLGAAPTYTQSGNLANAGTGSIDWIEFVFFNNPSSTSTATDFYIKSLEISDTAPAGQPGDFNSDGKVDAADYVVYRKNNGTNSPLANDNGLGTPIGTAHFNLWRSNFGEMAGAGGGQSVGAVPELGTFAYLCAAFTGLIVTRLPRGCRRPASADRAQAAALASR
jgi:hypothetical protein